MLQKTVYNCNGLKAAPFVTSIWKVSEVVAKLVLKIQFDKTPITCPLQRLVNRLKSKTYMKKATKLLLTLFMAISLLGCGGEPKNFEVGGEPKNFEAEVKLPLSVKKGDEFVHCRQSE